MSFETIEQMAKICDALHEEYLTQETVINNILGTLHFPKNADCKYKLFAIRNDVWEILYSNMEKQQYIYPDYDDNAPFVFTNGARLFYLHKKGTRDNYAKIELVCNGNYYDVLWTPTDENSVCRRKKLGVDGSLWIAEYTYDKSVSKYIPEALTEYERNEGALLKHFFSRKKNIEYNEEYLVERGMIKSYWEE